MATATATAASSHATLAKLLTIVGGSLVATPMVFHGFAHGVEMPAGRRWWLIWLGSPLRH
jgi:hydrogenase/urease accessory protein HupE